MKKVRLLAAALVVCASGPVQAQYIDSYVKHHSLLMMTANSYTTKLGSMSTTLYAVLGNFSISPGNAIGVPTGLRRSAPPSCGH